MSEAASTSKAPRYAITATDKQRSQLERLLKDPQKPAFIPAPPEEKSVRPAREMMKNVQGSSAGAGSGEFHVYRAGRRREYERIALLQESAQKETDDAEFERKRKEADDAAEAKTAKNRAKRQKKKERAKGGGKGGAGNTDKGSSDAPLKKRRLVNGTELVFKKPGEGSDDDDEDEVGPQAAAAESEQDIAVSREGPKAVDTAPRITIHED
ncbi:hypothetical protein MKEN_00608700 [Mycena kentingensis (nom. inval.)]|nr:hypothetical protein MKEN_00608700 [Mycena kentingensis (nom. inval.)]